MDTFEMTTEFVVQYTGDKVIVKSKKSRFDMNDLANAFARIIQMYQESASFDYDGEAKQMLGKC